MECQFDLNPTFKSALLEKPSFEVRSQAFGRDRSGAFYWLFMVEKNRTTRSFDLSFHFFRIANVLFEYFEKMSMMIVRGVSLPSKTTTMKKRKSIRYFLSEIKMN